MKDMMQNLQSLHSGLQVRHSSGSLWHTYSLSTPDYIVQAQKVGETCSINAQKGATNKGPRTRAR